MWYDLGLDRLLNDGKNVETRGELVTIFDKYMSCRPRPMTIKARFRIANGNYDNINKILSDLNSSIRVTELLDIVGQDECTYVDVAITMGSTTAPFVIKMLTGHAKSIYTLNNLDIKRLNSVLRVQRKTNEFAAIVIPVKLITKENLAQITDMYDSLINAHAKRLNVSGEDVLLLCIKDICQYTVAPLLEVKDELLRSLANTILQIAEVEEINLSEIDTQNWWIG